MYLKNIAIKNIGPIEELSVELPFKENGNPKPIIFVGENGSGKTILQSQIIDAFYEIGGSIFNDIKISQGINHKYFKISGGMNLQIGKNKGFSALQFEEDADKVAYLDKVGDITLEIIKESISTFSLSPKNKENEKLVTNLNDTLKKKVENSWINGAYFYQPAYRYEEPFWKVEDFKHESNFSDTKRYSGKLKKEVEIVSSNQENKQFILDLILDYTLSQLNINSLIGNNAQESLQNPTIVSQVQIIAFDLILWHNINEILKKVKQKQKIEFHIGQRGESRVGILDKDTNSLLPINNLSLGESVLLNLFINIVRHSCQYRSKPLSEIVGVVAIDEVDIHLHTDLQNSVLPQLIKLFPKIQFIITTHSPLFLLGMKKTFGEENFEIRNMPKGELITTERFSEFENAYNILKETEKFEDEVKTKVIANNKPIVYVEGPTDVLYIKKAYELYEKTCDGFEVEIIGEKTDSGTKNSNNKALSNAQKLLSTNLNLLKQKVILLNDPEESIEEKDYDELLYIRKIPQFTENPLQKGIENLFEQDFINKVETEFSNDFSYLMKAGNKKNFKIDGNKQNICDWICTNGVKKDFKNFKTIFDIIEKCLGDK